jgi:hypothetical protein
MRREESRSDEELLAATATDADAFAAFYRRHLRSVLAYPVHRTGRLRQRLPGRPARDHGAAEEREDVDDEVRPGLLASSKSSRSASK